MEWNQSGTSFFFLVWIICIFFRLDWLEAVDDVDLEAYDLKGKECGVLKRKDDEENLESNSKKPCLD